MTQDEVVLYKGEVCRHGAVFSCELCMLEHENGGLTKELATEKAHHAADASRLVQNWSIRLMAEQDIAGGLRAAIRVALVDLGRPYGDPRSVAAMLESALDRSLEVGEHRES